MRECKVSFRLVCVQHRGRWVSDSSIFLYFGWVLKDRRGATATCSFLFFRTQQSQRRPYRKEVVYSSHGCGMSDHCGAWAICSINHLRTPYRFQIAAGNTRCHIYGCIATTIVFLEQDLGQEDWSWGHNSSLIRKEEYGWGSSLRGQLTSFLGSAWTKGPLVANLWIFAGVLNSSFK